MSAALSQSSGEILDLRHFSGSDLRPLLEVECEQWLRAMRWDYRGSAEMILRYLDSKILPGYAAVRDGRVVGYAFFVYEGSKGVLGDLFVDPREPDAGMLEHSLLMHALETLQQSPGIHRIEAQLLLYPRNTLAGHFTQAGARRHVRLFMELPLGGELPKPGRVAEGFAIRRWTEDDFQASAAIITQAYRGHVDSEINDQYRSQAGALRFLNNIVRFPGCGTFDLESSFVAAHRLTREIAGIILCSRVNLNIGHVTQVCLTPAFRGFHLGEALVLATAENLKQRNFAALSLTVTEANLNAVRLYRKLGFIERRAFDAFVWEG